MSEKAKIILIVGENINKNSSTNIYKRKIIEGLSICTHLEVVMGTEDPKIMYRHYALNGVIYHEINTNSALINILKKLIWHKNTNNNQVEGNNGISQSKANKKKVLNIYNSITRKYIEIAHPIYRYYSKLVSRANLLTFDSKYDAIVSISHPIAVHKAACCIKDRLKENCKLIQIWFELWYENPMECKKTKRVIKEENNLLEKSTCIYYSNIIQYSIQRDLFPQYVNKMTCFDLPVDITCAPKNEHCPYYYGYYGSYYGKVRNIVPVYNAMLKSGKKCIVVGESDIKLQQRTNIDVIGKRIPYQECAELEANTLVLVVLLNKENQSLPGKIYEYANSDHPVLVVLDGECQVIENIRAYFQHVPNYYFTVNNAEAIEHTMSMIQNDIEEQRQYSSSMIFKSSALIKSIMNDVIRGA